jgi:hypothetical protein
VCVCVCVCARAVNESFIGNFCLPSLFSPASSAALHIFVILLLFVSLFSLHRREQHRVYKQKEKHTLPMPPKLTSKNIFDVVFAQLPADAFIDTGPTSLREELMLEAAGLSGGGDSSSSGGGRGGGGSSQFRRSLLPSSAITTMAGGAGGGVLTSSASPAGALKSAVAAARPSTAAAEDDVLGDADATDGLDGAAPSSPADPSSSATSATTTITTAATGGFPGSDGHSLFRRVEDVATPSPHPNRSVRVRGGKPSTGDYNDVDDGSGAPVDFAVQMDDDDEAVKEAMKHAKLLAAVRDGAGEADEERNSQREEKEGDQVDGAGRLGAVMREADTATTTPRQGAAAAAAAMNSTERRQGGSTTAGSARKHASLDKENAGGATDTSAEGVGLSGGTNLSAAPPCASVAATLSSTTAVGSRGGHLTAAEQLSLMPPGLDRVYTGACVMYRHPKGFGFLSPDLGGPDVYFVNDGVALSFTRLALRAFYLRHALPMPPSVASVFHGEAPKASVVAHEGNEDVIRTGVSAVEGTSGLGDGETNTHASPAQTTPTTTEAAEATAAATSLVPHEGVLGNTVVGSHGVVEDVADRVSVPPTTAEELQQAEAAANLLTTATAQLLQHQVDQGFGGGLRVGERLSFVVTRNHAGRGGNTRLLRAEFIRGLPSAHYAMPVEQSWFAPMFPGVVGRKINPYSTYHMPFHHPTNPGESGTSSACPNGSMADGGEAASNTSGTAGSAAALVRYTGCVRTYDAEDQRGYLRCDETDGTTNATPDVVFHAHSVLWDLNRCPPLRRQVKESMRVAYSVCGTERNGKYIATLITTPEGQPFSEENMTFAENVLPFYMADNNNRRRGRADDGSGGLGGSRAMVGGTDGGMGGGNDGVGGDRKRGRAAAAEEDMLLLEEDDYPFL